MQRDKGPGCPPVRLAHPQKLQTVGCDMTCDRMGYMPSPGREGGRCTGLESDPAMCCDRAVMMLTRKDLLALGMDGVVQLLNDLHLGGAGAVLQVAASRPTRKI